MKFLINRSDAIGDLALTLPLIPYIKEKNPKAKVAFIVSSKNAELMEYAESVDQYWVYDKNKNIFFRIYTLLNIFWEYSPDIYLYVGGSHLVSFVAWILRVKNRGGLKSRLASFLFLNVGVRQPRALAVMHESEYNFNLLNPFDYKYHYADKEKYYPRIVIPKQFEVTVLNSLKDHIKYDHFIMIHPGMTGHTLNWPTLSYARLIKLIEEKYPNTYTFIISFTNADTAIIKEIKDYFLKPDYKKFDQKIYYHDGSIGGLGSYMALLKNAKFFIGPSTGPTHLASMLKVPLVTLYSPIKTQSALRWGPFFTNVNNMIIVPEVVCGEERVCSQEKCPYFPCMSKIEVDDVIDCFTSHIKAELN